MFKFEFSEQMTATIGQLLENAPYKIAAPILVEMQKQISAQRAATSMVPRKNGELHEEATIVQ